MSTENLAPIIIKKKKVVGGEGHHGGAWKVAYADFVTAMMAFFLLMWLLNATTEQQRTGLADYFSPTIPINKVSGGGGDGQFWGDSMFSEDVVAQNGTGASMATPTEQNQASGSLGIDRMEERARDSSKEARLREAEHLLEQLQARGGESMALLEEMRHVISKLTEEGLVFEIFELPDVKLFQEGTGEPTEELRLALRYIVDSSRVVANDMAITSHLAAVPLVLASNPVWDTSTKRAHTVRLAVQRLGFPANRIQKVTGFADRKPAVKNPMAIRNNRVEIIFLRDDV